MDEYYVVGVTTVPYQGLVVIINIISKEDNSYLVTIGNMSQCTCLNFNYQNIIWCFWKREGNVLQTRTPCLPISIQRGL